MPGENTPSLCDFGGLMLLSNILVLSQPTMASVEDWSVCSCRNPPFERRAGTDGFVPRAGGRDQQERPLNDVQMQILVFRLLTVRFRVVTDQPSYSAAAA